MSQSISLPYKLPSFGSLYNRKIPDGSVIIYPMRGEHEELLAGTADQSSTSLIVLQRVTQQLIPMPPDFKFHDLLVTDWMACLINLLAFSYSSEITMKPKCPTCNFSFVQKTNVTDLQCTYANDIGLDKQQEPFTTPPLPRSGDVIQYRLLRLNDLNKIHDYAQKVRNIRGAAGGDPAVTYTTATLIHAINDDLNLSDADCIKWTRKALACDLQFLRQEMTKWDTGYDLKPRFICPECREEFEVPLPLDFFRQIASNARRS